MMTCIPTTFKPTEPVEKLDIDIDIDEKHADLIYSSKLAFIAFNSGRKEYKYQHYCGYNFI